MFRTALVALILSSSTAMALGPQDQLYANVAQELPHYVQGVDVSTLSHHQICAGCCSSKRHRLSYCFGCVFCAKHSTVQKEGRKLNRNAASP
jgi:hypothetical protein